ncbi:MAG: winged helix DNA-binding domain-containing protein [Planctomycetota bacterium]|nr:winged helix DNA-binding domain-containing protein [Planctomycetota bacterium]
MSPTEVTVPVADASRLLLAGCGLTDDPGRRALPKTVYKAIERMGFVQLDTINAVGRAHHLTMAARFDGYRDHHLIHLLEEDRRLFEQWTHDASAIPTVWFAHWKRRSLRLMQSLRWKQWLREQLGARHRQFLATVLDRIRQDGPLGARDFADTRKARAEGSSWWNWKPSKTALAYLWRRGDLSVTRRDGFSKVYDLTERVFPDLHDAGPTGEREYVDWACSEAMARLGVATPSEIAGFFKAVTVAEARAWCKRSDTAVPVTIEGRDAPPAKGYALPDWRAKVRSARARLDKLEDRIRFLAPFDPLLRDRKRAARLFGFEYRFEAYTPPAKRVYGYYVLPMLRGERIVGRCDAKVDRNHRRLDVHGIWWEPGVRPARGLLSEALGRLADFAGARRISLPK